MTNELKPGEYISEFVSGGPKNYAYRVKNHDASKYLKNTVCKVRGITLNYAALQVVNFEVLRSMISRREPESVTAHKDQNIKCKRKGESTVAIITEPEDKMYRVSFFKRKRLPDNSSVHIGYK
jgi:hypothetical protein